MFRDAPVSMKEWEIREVDAARMKGIKESYSGDTIASEKRVRKPFEFGGKLYISIGGFSGPDIQQEEECYILIPSQAFKGDATYYGQKLTWPVIITKDEEEYAEDWDGQRRCQPEGFYHRMLVVYHSKVWILIGPPILFRLKQGAIAPKQLALKL